MPDMPKTALAIRKWTMIIDRWMGVTFCMSASYIDPRTGKVVESYGARSRWNRWLYHGLHSLDLPWLYARRPVWDIIVISLMLGGTALSITSLSIAWKVIRRKMFRSWRPPERQQLVSS